MSNTYTTKKALKISTALYMITDIMSEKEPLKWHLRGCAVSLLEADIHNMRDVVERTIDILTIARIARAVSAMNADVLEDELKILLEQTIKSSDGKEDQPVLFNKTFFEVKRELETPKNIKKDTLDNNINNKEVKEIEEEVLGKNNVEKPKDENDEENVIVERPATTLIPQGIRSSFSPSISLVEDDIIDRNARNLDVKSNRRDTIIKAIREKDTCSIKDIAEKLADVSEKTIQRELVSMTEEGILIKEGDRRWATYRISSRI